MRRGFIVFMAALVLGTAALVASAATQVGFRAHSFNGWGAEQYGSDITGQKPESKLWTNDGVWWAAMVSPAAQGAHTIHRLDATSWVDTGVVIDTRPSTKEDILWTGQKLYILSRASGFVGNSLLRRFTYTGSTYQLDAGFPIVAPGTSQEATTIARDSLGVLWVTYEKSNKIYVARTPGTDTSFGAPFVLPVAGASFVNTDDISAVISFTDAAGPAIGVMWSNQNDETDYFAVHRDGAADSAWTVETALTGAKEADDHISLKTHEGRVYSVVKTSQTESTKPLIRLLVRSETGVWSAHAVATVAEKNTRPITILDIDPATRRVYIFMTIGEGPNARGIAYKHASLDAISFGSSATVLIRGPGNEEIDNATSTKQNVTPETGIVILAADKTHYWWNRIGGTQPPNTAPTANASSAVTGRDAPVSVSLSGSDAQTCELSFAVLSPPSHGSLGSIGGAACVPGSPNQDAASVVYTPASGYTGPDSFSYTVSDASLTSPAATVSITVQADPPPNTAPTANASSAVTTQNTPVSVGLSGADAQTCQLSFAVSSAQSHGSLGAIAGAPCVPGSPNQDAASVVYTPDTGYTGPDSFAYTVSDGALTSTPATIGITVQAPSASITFRSASAGTNPTATSLTIGAPSAAQPGDVMIGSVDARGNPVIAPPAGWTLVRSDQNGTAMVKATYVHVVAGSEPPSYTWTFSKSVAAAGGIAAYSGVSTSSPVAAQAGTVSTTNQTTSIIAPGVTTTVNGAMIVALWGVANNSTVTPTGSMTERFDVASNAGTYKVTSACADAIQAGAGATGDRIGASLTTGWNVGHLVALRPAGS